MNQKKKEKKNMQMKKRTNTIEMNQKKKRKKNMQMKKKEQTQLN